MDLFDRIKATVNQMTGNSVTVQLQVADLYAQRGQAISFIVYLSAAGPLKARSVNADLRAVEIIQFDVPIHTATGSNRMERRSKQNETYHYVQPVASLPFEMQRGDNQQLTGTLLIPPNVQPTYHGIDSHHVWLFRVYLDVAMGADPAVEQEIQVL